MKKKIYTLILLVITILFVPILIKSNNFSALEIDRNITRQQYLGQGLGRIYGNRLGIYFFKTVYPRATKLEINLFTIFGNIYLYTPLFIGLGYFGWKKHAKK